LPHRKVVCTARRLRQEAAGAVGQLTPTAASALATVKLERAAGILEEILEERS
jgi:hypothetical protein